ncbi:MAG: hypothetical protein AB8B80_03385 [Marinicellaceae bacterium]
MKKKLYLHIGFHKTGTSALQEFFDRNRDELLKNGVYYIKSYDTRFPANVDLSWAFNQDPPPWASFEKGTSSEIIAHYNKKLKNNVCDTVIISSEDFCLFDKQPQSIRNLKTFLSDYDVKIVAYLRDPMEFIISLYCHAVRSRAVSYDLKTHIAQKYKFFAADFYERLDPWLQEFGRDNLIIKNYAPKEFVNNNLVDDFFEAINTKIVIDNPIYKRSNVGTHVWLIKPYIEISNADIDEKTKKSLLHELTKLGKNLPKVDKASYLLEEQDINIFNKAYDTMKQKIYQEYQVKL